MAPENGSAHSPSCILNVLVLQQLARAEPWPQDHHGQKCQEIQESIYNLSMNNYLILKAFESNLGCLLNF